MNGRLLLPILLFLPLFLSGCPGDPPPATGNGYWKPDSAFATDLKNQESGSNGIEVGEPKIYDDASLRMMLEQARLRLAAINGLNESALVSHLGAITGSTIDQTQFGVQVGPNLPTIATSANGPTSQTTTNSGLPAGQTSLPASTTVATNPSQSVVTTSTPPASPIPTVPSGLAYTPPGSMAGSALDVLNEEMQLTYETANLQLLLEGALSDRFVKNQRIIKPRTTIGFPISLKPQSRYKNAVAVVEVEVETAARNLSDKDQPDPPTITALLPQEKTYNVAAIKDRMTSIGAGAVVNAISVGGSWSSGHKTFYVVQDQDTVAIERPADPNRPNTTSFAWEFRPVLGEEFVRGGLKQTFVQLALPILDPKDCYGSIHIRTYWRRFDRKNGIDREPIAGSVLSRTKLSIPHYDLAPWVEDVRYQDLGDATVLVTVQGSFLAGTYVQLGATRFDAAKSLLVEESGLKFVAPAAALAMWTAKVVSRDGNSTDLLNPLAQEPLPKLNQLACGQDDTKKTTPSSSAVTVAMQNVQISPNRDKVRMGMQKTAQLAANPAGVSLVDNRTQARVELASSSAVGFESDHPILTAGMDSTRPCPFGSIHIKQVTLTPLNEGESELLVAFDPIKDPMTTFPDDILLDVGHKVFGLADTAVKRDLTPTAPTITAIVPAALLVSGRKVRAFRMFWTAPNNGQSADPRSNCFDTAKDLSDFDLDSAVERLVLVSVDADGKATYLLYGNGLDHAKILVPTGLNVVPIDSVGQGRIARIDITKEILKQTKKIVLQKMDKERPLVLDVPQPDAGEPDRRSRSIVPSSRIRMKWKSLSKTWTISFRSRWETKASATRKARTPSASSLSRPTP